MAGDSPLILLWSESVLVSLTVWTLVSILVLYLARTPAQALLDRSCQALAEVLRLGAALLLTYARRAAARNRDVLRAMAEDALARRIDRQFRRLAQRIDHDLGGYPALHRALQEQVRRVDSDYRHTDGVPPTPPAWLAAVEAVASLEVHDDPAVTRILRDMQATLEAACHDGLQEYRVANQRRLRVLQRLQPYLQRIENTLDQLQQRLAQLSTQTRALDRDLRTYQQALQAHREPLRKLDFELHLRAFAGWLLLAAAGLAALLDHHLIAAPLNGLLELPGSAWPAAALMLIELGLGVWIAEAAGWCRLLGVLDQADDRLRRRLAVVGLVLLTALSLLQAGLAWQASTLTAEVGWAAPVTAALLAALLPFVLALAALPLESVATSTPLLLGGLLIGMARITAAALRLAAAAVTALPTPLKHLYDLWIFLPLWGEQMARSSRPNNRTELSTSRFDREG